MDEGSTESLNWRRSSFCDTSACVEVALRGPDILVRQSFDTKYKRLYFTHEEWAQFLAGVKNGDFDLD